MNDLPSNLVPPNQRDLERVEQGDKFPAEPDNVDKDFKFFVYPFSKMKEKTLGVRPACKSPNFGLVLEADPQYGQAYILDVNAKSSAAHLFSSLNATCKAIRLSYIVKIAGHCIFSETEASTTLAKLYNAGVSQFHITFAVEPALMAK